MAHTQTLSPPAALTCFNFPWICSHPNEDKRKMSLLPKIRQSSLSILTRNWHPKLHHRPIQRFASVVLLLVGTDFLSTSISSHGNLVPRGEDRQMKSKCKNRNLQYWHTWTSLGLTDHWYSPPVLAGSTPYVIWDTLLSRGCACCDTTWVLGETILVAILGCGFLGSGDDCLLEILSLDKSPIPPPRRGGVSLTALGYLEIKTYTTFTEIADTSRGAAKLGLVSIFLSTTFAFWACSRSIFAKNLVKFPTIASGWAPPAW